MLVRILPKLIVSLLIGALFAWLVSAGGVPLLPPSSAFASVAGWAVPAYAAIYVLTHAQRALRWRHLIAPTKHVPIGEVLGVNLLGFFAIWALPLRLGEFARPVVCKARLGISVSVGLGTVVAERVVDGLIASVAVVWALSTLPRLPVTDALAQGLPFYAGVAVAGFTTALLLIFLFLWKRSLARRLVEAVVGLFFPALATIIAEKVERLADGLESLTHVRLATKFGLESLVYWFLQALGAWVLALGCGLPLNLAHGVAIISIVALGILLPAGPGMFGTFQLAAVTTLRLYVANALLPENGAVFVFWLYAVQAVLITVAGVVPLYVFNIPFASLLGRSRDRKPSEASAAGTG